MTILWFIFLPAVLAGLVQGITGFGSAIVLMVFLPSILPIPQSAGVASLIMSVSNLMLAVRYRKHVKVSRLIGPFIVYAGVAFFSLKLGGVLDVKILKMLLGLLLIGLSVYFLFFKKMTAKQHYPIYVAIAFMVISGILQRIIRDWWPLDGNVLLVVSGYQRRVSC